MPNRQRNEATANIRDRLHDKLEELGTGLQRSGV